MSSCSKHCSVLRSLANWGWLSGVLRAACVLDPGALLAVVRDFGICSLEVLREIQKLLDRNLLIWALYRWEVPVTYLFLVDHLSACCKVNEYFLWGAVNWTVELAAFHSDSFARGEGGIFFAVGGFCLCRTFPFLERFLLWDSLWYHG